MLSVRIGVCAGSVELLRPGEKGVCGQAWSTGGCVPGIDMGTRRGDRHAG